MPATLPSMGYWELKAGGTDKGALAELLPKMGRDVPACMLVSKDPAQPFAMLVSSLDHPAAAVVDLRKTLPASIGASAINQMTVAGVCAVMRPCRTRARALGEMGTALKIDDWPSHKALVRQADKDREQLQAAAAGAVAAAFASIAQLPPLKPDAADLQVMLDEQEEPGLGGLLSGQQL